MHRCKSFFVLFLAKQIVFTEFFNQTGCLKPFRQQPNCTDSKSQVFDLEEMDVAIKDGRLIHQKPFLGDFFYNSQVTGVVVESRKRIFVIAVFHALLYHASPQVAMGIFILFFFFSR